jgi:ketosteroid isomerase-like protein
MSRENVEIVRQFIDEVNSGRDWGAAGARFMSDDIEIDWSRSPAPYRGIYRGREAARRFAEETDVWEETRIEPKDFIDAGDDVLVPHVIHLRGRDALEVKVRATYVYTLRNGLCVRWRIYQEHAEALEAVGLSEQDARADA